METISEKSLAVIKKMQQSEITESAIYAEIAKFVKGEDNKKTLERLSRQCVKVCIKLVTITVYSVVMQPRVTFLVETERLFTLAIQTI